MAALRAFEAVIVLRLFACIAVDLTSGHNHAKAISHHRSLDYRF